MGSPAELSHRAQVLAVDCRKLESELTSTRDETFEYLRSLNTSSLVDVFLKGDEVQFHVTMTLVYRAVPPPEGSISRFCSECLDSARKAMKVHQESLSLLDYGTYIKSIYVHWYGFNVIKSSKNPLTVKNRNLMLTPFAPFFVLFCHIIETLSSEDLKILQEFVASFESLRNASETIDKLCRVFQVYRDVAMVYVDAKSQQQEDQTMVPINDEFDMYLSQLGFMPTEDHASMPQAGGQPSTSAPMPTSGNQATQMADWFSGSRNMFGLLEEDLSQIDASRWMNHGT